MFALLLLLFDRNKNYLTYQLMRTISEISLLYKFGSRSKIFMLFQSKKMFLNIFRSSVQ